MQIRRIAAITAVGAVVAGGAGIAVGATTGNKAEQDVLADAAKRLDVTPDKLRDALAAAQDAQLDAAVKAGELTQEQADRIRAARERSGRVLGGPGIGGPGRHHRGPRRPGGGPIMAEAAEALGISEAKLFSQLRAGRSVADVAEAEGKDLDAVKGAVRAAVKARLDEAVARDRLTREQADRMLEHLEEHIARFDEAAAFHRRRAHHPPPPTDRP